MLVKQEAESKELATQLNTAVLLIAFNRPETTARVFEAIRHAAPTRLYVAVDGPREGDIEENELCKQVREVVTNVDWDCEIKTLFRDHNLGCKHGCVSAIDWFFENEEMGIILEDDILPDHSFFKYCEDLLIKYYDDNTVMHINGVNFSKDNFINDCSYYFSYLPVIWGWATWKYTWDNYDLKVSSWKDNKNNKNMFDKFKNKYVRYIFARYFDMAFHDQIDTWDYQYNYLIWINDWVSITPSVNLIVNIGFDNDATHTNNTNGPGSQLVSNNMEFPLLPIRSEIINHKYDQDVLDQHYRCNLIFSMLYKLYEYAPFIRTVKSWI